MKFFLFVLVVLFFNDIWAFSPSVPYQSCLDYKVFNAGKSCASEFSGVELQVCSVCRENKSCFFSMGDHRQRGLCHAYLGNKSCLMALDGPDRGWCQVLVENKTCEVFRGQQQKQKRCHLGQFPRYHLFWL